jgi:signal transduction histidine kinase
MDEMLDEQVGRGQITAAQAAAMKALDRSRPQHYSRVRGDGRVLDTVSEPTPDGGFVITYSDVTEDRRIRAELERARAEAEAASEAKSRFLATMSHELRTPLNAVIGLSEAIGLDDDARRTTEYAAMINEAGRHLLQLVDDILDVARSQTGALRAAEEPVEPGAVIAAAAAAAGAAARAAGLALGTVVPHGLPRLRGDAQRLRQVLDKLLSNAVKFTPAGGRITLSADAGPDGMRIRVTDTGIGIPPAERERMFEPFTQLDSSLARRFQGSGLGLHLARALAATIGATLTLEDPEGPGIVAVLRFPAGRLMLISTETTEPA